MAFSADKFVKNTAKSAAEKIVTDVVSKTVSGLPMSSKLIASSTAQSLFNVGASYESIQALSAQKTDAIISGASNDFFALAGKAVGRVAGANISKLRRSGNEDINQFLDKINPATKIKNSKKSNTPEIISVL